MKTIKWDKVNQFSVGDYPTENGKMLFLNNKIKLGMEVSAEYKELQVFLEINEEINSNVFKAEVKFFEPPAAKQPDDLSVGDEVLIKREDIKCLYI